MLGRCGNPDHDADIRIANEAIDASINLIDVAGVYCAGESELITARREEPPRRCGVGN
jgi:aryl-alcohol dehydrogenase-like predicted oxidoreductase